MATLLARQTLRAEEALSVEGMKTKAAQDAGLRMGLFIGLIVGLTIGVLAAH